MKLAIMQPYFLPYIGYFQLLSAVDVFVVYDNIKYTKKGWINRNRFLLNGADAPFTLPLKSDADYLDVVERRVSDAFEPAKLLAQWAGAYAKAPCYPDAHALMARILENPERNLFGFLDDSIRQVCEYLGITTPIVRSSKIAIDHDLKGQDRVLAICSELGCQTYINAIGGTSLYDEASFRAKGIDLRFIRSRPVEYPQFGHAFVPNLSILDVMMFNPRERIAEFLGSFDLIPGAEALQLQEAP